MKISFPFLQVARTQPPKTAMALGMNGNIKITLSIINCYYMNIKQMLLSVLQPVF